MYKNKIIIFILTFFFSISLYSTPIAVSTITPMENSKIEMIVVIPENPFSISILYDDTNLNKSTKSVLRVFDNEYILSKAAKTHPFYINLSEGDSKLNYLFSIKIKLGEFIGKDYQYNEIKTAIYPNIEPYSDYHYSFEKDEIEKSATMTYYQQKGLSEAKHIGAFIFSWDNNDGLSAGTYTSSNTIFITAEDIDSIDNL